MSDSMYAENCRHCTHSREDYAALQAYLTRINKPASDPEAIRVLRRCKYYVYVRHDDWTTLLFANAFVVRRGHWYAVVAEHNGDHIFSGHDVLVWQLTPVPIPRADAPAPRVARS